MALSQDLIKFFITQGSDNHDTVKNKSTFTSNWLKEHAYYLDQALQSFGLTGQEDT